MLEGVPGPDHLQIAVEHQDHVSQHVHRSRVLDIRDHLLGAGQRQYLSVPGVPDLVMERIDFSLSHGSQLFIDARRVRLQDAAPRQIELPQDLLGRVRKRRFEQPEEKAAGFRPGQDRNADRVEP